MAVSGTNASDSLFGWDFQINAAIVLMLEDIENIQEIRVEGKSEDIEITRVDGGSVFSQAKALADPSSTSNVRKKLSDGFRTLNQAALNPNIYKLVYITNAYNPLADKQSMASFYGQSRKPYSALSRSAKQVVDGVLKKGSLSNIDLDKLFIYTLPFENDINDRYKVVIEKVKDFISSIKSSLSGTAQEMLDVWQQQLFENATRHETSVVLSKEDIMWPLIVIMCDNEARGNPFVDEMDDGEYDEISARYKNFISCKSQKFQFVTSVISDLRSYPKGSAAGNDHILAFINERWESYLNEFSQTDTKDDLLELLIKITLFRVIQQRRLVSDVKKRVNLL